MRRIAALTLAALALATTGRVEADVARTSLVPTTSDTKAARYCLNPTKDGRPASQAVTAQGPTVSVVAVCVQDYQYVPGDDNVEPCAGHFENPAVPAEVPSCVSARSSVPANALEVPRGTTLLFVVPDPNMHTLTSDNCPNAFEDPATIEPLPDAAGHVGVEGVSTAEQAQFGPDAISTGTGRCWFDTYTATGDQALSGPGYESVDTAELPRGRYPFYCQVHAFMRGTLVVD